MLELQIRMMNRQNNFIIEVTNSLDGIIERMNGIDEQMDEIYGRLQMIEEMVTLERMKRN